ncbi:MAG TPA: hypothetical protein VK694_01190 [Verrucomicrobiae bacterium]|nr:hypothetical protein [Verrucomicrobiae bacterium]
MLKLEFTPEDENVFELTLALYGYQKCWQAHGSHVQAKLEELTGLSFQQPEITAVVVAGSVNNSGMTGKPMRVGSDYRTDNEKLAVLSHELSHRLLGGNGVGVDSDRKDAKYAEHCRIYLFLYDAWCDLKDESFANSAMERELADAEYYEKAWKWALGMDRQQRSQELKKIIASKI